MRLARCAIAALSLTSASLATRAGAQLPDSSSAFTHLLGVRLRPMVAVYRTRIERGGAVVSLGSRTITTGETTYAGNAAWLLVETRPGDGVPAADSLTVSRFDLRPLHWGSTLGGARLSAEFSGETVYGATSGPPGRGSVSGSVPPGTIVTAAMLHAVLRVISLRPGWVDSTSTMAVTLGNASAIPTHLSVVGEERIEGPAGRYDCWVVSVTTDATRATFWVSKGDQLVVRSRETVGSIPDGVLESDLARVSP